MSFSLEARRGRGAGGADLSQAGRALAPVANRSTMQDGVYQQLRHALMTGLFDPGQVLTIAALADRFRTSPMPVREALRRLAAENAVEIGASGSARVPPVSTARLADLCRARIAIEGFTAELAAVHATAADHAAIEAAAVAHEAAGAGADVFVLLAHNQAFHFALYRASQSDVLLQTIETLWLRFGPYMRRLTLHLEPKGRAIVEGGENHAAILRALRAGDAGAVREAVAADLAHTQVLLQGLLQTDDRRAAS